MDFELARHNMVEQQIRTWDVVDARILDLVARATREDYVPPAYRQLAFADMNIPIGHGQVMLQPKMEARIVQDLEIKPTDKILEVGTGTGFFTSLLSALGQHVYSVDLYPEFARTALEKLARHNHRNVTLEVGDAAKGWDRHAPYDVIILTSSVPVLPSIFTDSLAVGGRLFAVVGRAPVMEAKIIERLDKTGFAERSLFETDIPALINVVAPPVFKL